MLGGCSISMIVLQADWLSWQCRLPAAASLLLIYTGSHGYVDLKEHNTCDLSQRVQAVKRSPRYSLMIALKEEAINAPFDGVTVKNNQVIEWISKDSSKPGKHHLAWLNTARMHAEPVCLLTVALHIYFANSTLERLLPCSFYDNRDHLRHACTHRSSAFMQLEAAASPARTAALHGCT